MSETNLHRTTTTSTGSEIVVAPGTGARQSVDVQTASRATAQRSLSTDDYEREADVDELPNGDGFPEGWEGDEPDADLDRMQPRSSQRRVMLGYRRAEGGRLELQLPPRSPHAEIDGRQFQLDPHLREQRLEALGTALLEMQYAALDASSPAEAFSLLTPMSMAALVSRANQLAGTGVKLNTTETSRDRDVVITTPWGKVPIQFFTWYVDEDRRPRYQQVLDIALVERPADPPTASALARSVGDPSDAFRKMIAQRDTLFVHRRRVAGLRRSPERWHDDELDRLCTGRGQELFKFAIAGWEAPDGNEWMR